jgi:outer membrane protease
MPRIRVLLLTLALSPAASAEEPPAAWDRGEISIRYWLSTGETKNSHNARAASPIVGNPTSVLTWENLDAHVLELAARTSLAGNWFIKGNLGVGSITGGSFDDEDYLAGQFKFLDTTSSVPEGTITYATFDIGITPWVLQGGRGSAGIFLGYNQWTEEVDAFGITQTADPLGVGGGNLPDSVLVISNKAQWKSLRLGLLASLAFSERAKFVADLAYVPYSKIRNEDSHHLRPDLGPVPNVIKEGVGMGVQLDAELRYLIFRRTTLGAGVRYWRLKAEHGTDNVDFPLVELTSERMGVTLSLARIW